MAYQAPLKDYGFLLHQVLGVQSLDIPGYDALDPEFTAAVLGAAGELASAVLAPLNAVGDKQGCRLEAGEVRTPDGFKAAFDSLRQGGWTALDAAPAHGGQGLPYLLHVAVNEGFVSANMALNMYQGLTHGAYSAVLRHGSPAQQALYLPRLASCQWTGTMNLTEPQCGTDLGLIRTRAEPDGPAWRITGTKIFISAGDHDLTENILHLVLARAPGGGPGTKGLSLFLVPKRLEDGQPNGLHVGRLESKMGIHGSATCEMIYEGAQGWLLGELHHGMRAMFTMMNEARLGVGMQGYAQAEAAYQAARAYALTRVQGNPAGHGPPQTLISHPDIRRMLMDQKAFIQGARALTFWAATLIDRAERGADAKAEALVSLLIPVIKGFLTDKGFAATVQAQQIWGGHGYIEDNPMSQFVRDARVAMIYEGANGVQALDLLGRKLMGDGGAALREFLRLVGQECGDAADADALRLALAQLQTALQVLLTQSQALPLEALAGANDLLHLMGHLCLGLMWLRMARAAQQAQTRIQAPAEEDAAFLQAKILTAQHYMTHLLPDCALHLARITAGGASLLALEAKAF